MLCYVMVQVCLHAPPVVADEAKLAIVFATTQLNSTQSWVSLIFLWEPQPQPQPQNHKPNRIPLYLSSYTTKLDQIQYATLFQPN